PIIVHPDVRRNLLSIRAFNEAARALVVWAALKSDIAHRSKDAAGAQAAADALGLVTPVLKGVLTDRGFDNAVIAQQVLGGHGYIEEWGMEQFVRDARIAMLYEGANGIQALDLVGRKLPKDGGRALSAFLGEVKAFIKENEAEPSLSPYISGLAQGIAHLEQATFWFMQNAIAKPDNAGAGSYDYMHLMGLVVLGFMWAHIAKAAIGKKAGPNGDAAAMDARLLRGKYFMERLMPETALRLARITSGAGTMMAIAAEQF
ncbi:MAG: acyl-CoA dehydrogenase C-terminal domain-containing protein, partial [Beijerinckiaceae bacterium]|nr:acyl-CoA dehydrogenase C-terminal domain-containing protein [Beijerinckiaceae bacterium]